MKTIFNPVRIEHSSGEKINLHLNQIEDIFVHRKLLNPVVGAFNIHKTAQGHDFLESPVCAHEPGQCSQFHTWIFYLGQLVWCISNAALNIISQKPQTTAAYEL